MTSAIVTLAELLEELNGYRARVPLDHLIDRLQRLDVEWPKVEPFVRFAPDTYRRNLVCAGPAYHALILCWRPGQRSPIHDHRGSSCGVRVLRGTCTETIFDRSESGHIYPVVTHRLPPGTCCGSADADIHQISNLGGDDLVTLHVYSPPLLVMGQYSLTSTIRGEFTDAVREFAEGAGI